MANSAASLPTRKGYRKDIMLVIFLKIVLLFVLWGLFFSNSVKAVIPAQVGIHFTEKSFIEKYK